MGTDQTIDVVATPRDRYCLMSALLHPKLTFKTRKDRKSLERAKEALDLHAVAERLLDGKQGRVPLFEDTKTYRKFTVTVEVAEFLAETVDRIPDGLTAGHLAGLQPLLSQLEDRTVAEAKCAKHPEAPTGDVVEDWSRSTAPILEDPSKYNDEVLSVYKACKKAGYDVKVLVDTY